MAGMEGQPAFGLTVKELRELMEHRGHDAYEKIQNDYGGVMDMCKLLKTHPHEGLFLCLHAR